MLKLLGRWLPISLLILGLVLFFSLHLDQYLTFETLKHHREQLLSWTHDHYFQAIAVYMAVYIITVAISVPGASYLTMASGFLFGIIAGVIIVVISATIGSLCVFFAVRGALEPMMARIAKKWIEKMRIGFQNNAFQYLMVLRIAPLFPFWVVNIVPALLGVPVSTYLITTFLGIIPGTAVYVFLGNGLGQLFDRNEVPNMGIIFEPQILIPIIALAILSVLPIFFKKRRMNDE